jgi:hypothetical protein
MRDSVVYQRILTTQIALFLQSMPDADLICDATGVGRAVIDSLRAASMKPISITITGGLEVNRISWRDIRVPKTELVSSLIVAAEQLRLKISPQIALREVLEREIASYSPRRTATGNLTFDAEGGEHDDCVMALAIGI